MPVIYFHNYEFTLITDKDGKPWFIAKELCDYLGLKNVATACRKIPDCNKQYMVFDHLKTTGKGTGRGGDNGRRIIVNEPGIYRLIGRSRKPEAEEFQRWLFHDVAPSIRKKGSYSIQPRIEAPKAPPQQIPRAPKTYKEAVQHLLVQIEENEKLIAINTDW
jgi:anti-repressor protein